MPRKKTASDTPSEATALILRGEDDVDRTLLDDAVAEINRIHTAKGLELARAIGNYVLQAFFEDDLDAFGRAEKKHATFRALAQREDLQVSYATVWYSVAVLGQLRLLPENIGSALPMAHHKMLLPVKDPKTKVRLAKKAVEKHLTSREFAEEVKRAQAGEEKGSGGGRPRLPAFVKGLGRLKKAVAMAVSEEVEAETFARYEPERVQELVEELDAQIGTLQALRARVVAAVEGGGDEDEGDGGEG